MVQSNIDLLIKQMFEELRTNEILINRLKIKFTENISVLEIEFDEITYYDKYLKLFKDANSIHTELSQNKLQQTELFTITFKIKKTLETLEATFKLSSNNINQEWIMQNLPPNVIVMEYDRKVKHKFMLDKLPRNLNSLIITESFPSNLKMLPKNLKKLNLYNCLYVKHNLDNLPDKIEILILPEDECEIVKKYSETRTYQDYDFMCLPHSINTICYGRLKMNRNQLDDFEYLYYDKYNNTFNKNRNIFDAFLSNMFLNNKKFFMTKYDYNENGWYHLAS